uniref:Histone-lysine N-methyltransferase n=1 Tax=Caenorhabditis japonica TaxID=281687 RepID=A0A8R1E4B2_CAEJA
MYIQPFSFYLGITRNWFSYPNYDRARSRIYDVVGYTVVEWILELREEGKKLKKQQQFTVCAISDLAPVVEPYLRLAPANTKDLWQKTADATDIYARLPTLYREVDKKLQTSRYAEKTLKKYTPCYETALCKCIGENRCTTEDCCFVASGFECPADCEENGQICNNRKISKKFVNPNITQRKAGRKGYGVFACGKIKKGEFLAEYVGEIINREERIRRRYIADNSADFQASHYIMEMAEGYAVDAARVGNISRYINHSCEPNARAQVFKSLITKTERKDNKKDYIDYEYRLGIVATKDIGVDEEVTFNYQMGDRNKSITDIPKCYCGTPSCTGYLTTRPTEGEDGENEKSYVAEYGREKRSSRKDFKPRSKKIEKQKTLKRKSAVTFNLNDEESPVKRRCSAPAPSRSVGRPKKNIEKVNGEKKERRHTILEGIEAYDTKIEIKEEEEEEEEMTLLTSSEPSDISIRRSSRGHVPKNKFQIDN